MTSVQEGTLITPLGGVLVNQVVDPQRRQEAIAEAAQLPSIRLPAARVADLELLATGAYSPLTGFLSRADYVSVVHRAQLADGTPWTLPITLPVPEGLAHLEQDAKLALLDGAGNVRGVLHVHEIYERDTEAEALEVYRTSDPAHPGVHALLNEGPLLAGGTVELISHRELPATSPAETRAEFIKRGWRTVVGFQTRNPMHRAHEHVTKVALEQVDGLLLHPLAGKTKPDDVPFDIRMRCYRVLMDHYYPPDRVVLHSFPAAMRYAGPREAVFHGLVRRNYGCSHFIIGRDAAGVGDYYGHHDSQRLYDELGGAARLGFTAVKMDSAFYCRACNGMASSRTCPHPDAERLTLSGTRIRELLHRGEAIPPEYIRPEVAAILEENYGFRAEVAS